MREVVEAASKGQTVKMISQRTGSGKRARNTAVSRFTAEEPIYLGPEAQKLLRGWLRPELGAYLFQPRDAEEERRATRRAARKSKVQPSQLNRRKSRPKREPGDRYDKNSYRRAVAYAIERANRDRARGGEPLIPSWHPHQLRHLAASRLQRLFGWDIARAVLGHESPDTTAVYVERDERLACEAALRVG